MNTFIEYTFLLNTCKKQHLKSNMDRFIVFQKCSRKFITVNLKSNMDRFIVFENEYAKKYLQYLKSNMDRFIAFIMRTVVR